MSIRLRLTIWYTAILSATLLLFSVGLYGVLYHWEDSRWEHQLREKSRSIQWDAERQFLNYLRGNPLTPFRQDLSNMFIQMIDVSTGDAVIQSYNLADASVEFPMPSPKLIQKLRQNETEITRVEIGAERFLVYHAPIRILVNGRVEFVGILQTGYYLGNDKLFGTLRWILTITSFVIVLIAASVGWFMARKALRPIDQVILAANQIGKADDLARRIARESPNDEIGRLTDTINGMLERIQAAYLEMEAAYRQQRRFVSDASHELRTPLTTIRGNVDWLEKMWSRALREAEEHGKDEDAQKLTMSLEAMHDISSEAERMTRLINDLLALARADAGYQMEKEKEALKPIVEAVVRKAQLLPRTVDWQPASLDSLNNIYVHGNKDYLQQLLFIFIENAFKYTDKGCVKLLAVKRDDQVGIMIEDTGIGMDKEEVPHIFDRFYRADVSRGSRAGTGLGLSIAKWIIDEHQGSIEVMTRKGEGTTFTIWMPELPLELAGLDEEAAPHKLTDRTPFQLPGESGIINKE